jgi:diaminopimelate epimerase
MPLAKDSLLLYIASMKTNTNTTIEEVRRTNLNLLVTEKGTLIGLASISGTSAAYLSQILTRSKMSNGKVREVGSKLARKLEDGCSKPLGWMDKSNTQVDQSESELTALWSAMDFNSRAAVLEHARLITKINK